MITGNASTRKVSIKGQHLSPRRSQSVWNHSPDGFSWGYEGSGPAQLALAVLLEVSTSEEPARRFYQDFKRDVIAKFPIDQDFAVPVEFVSTWLQMHSLAADLDYANQTD